MSDLARDDNAAPEMAPPDELVDPAWGDALEAMFARHQDELLGTLYYLVGNIEDARDALQESFVKCWKHRHQVTQLKNPRAWMFRIALNTGRDLRSTAWRRKRQGLVDEEAIEQPAHERPEEIAARTEQFQQLQQAIANLREEEKEVFLLRQNGELTYDEIAEALDIPTGTVKTRMRLAVKNLRKQFNDNDA